MAEPWMLCPYGCDAHVTEGGPRDADRYHCPRCMRCCPTTILAHAAYKRGAEMVARAVREALDSEKGSR